MARAESTSLAHDADSPRVFRVGTLVYTRSALFTLFAWLLWADATFTLMESVPGLIPLKMKSLSSPNWMTAVVVSTMPSLLNMTVCPWVSFKSDRYRSKWGRRIPFIICTAPFLSIALICIGFSAPIAKLANRLLLTSTSRFSGNAVEIGVVAIFATMFVFFNMFVGSVFWYLFNDVVPAEVMSRFLSAIRIVGQGAGTLFSLFIFRFAGTHLPLIFLGGGLLYFVSFTLVCLNVKEGQYPPVSDVAADAGTLTNIKTYFTECYSRGFYWLYFLYNAIANLANCVYIFGLFFNLQMGLTYAQMGVISAVSSALTAILLYPAGMLVDRIHPMRGAAISVTITTFIVVPVSLLWLFYNPSPGQFYIISLAIAPFAAAVGAIGAASSLPLEMHLFPRPLFGQFGSANALVRSVATLFGGLGAGLFMDYMKRRCHGNEFYYRFLPVWWLAFGLISYIFFVLLYRKWKSLGGPDGYTPPGFPAVSDDDIAPSHTDLEPQPLA